MIIALLFLVAAIGLFLWLIGGKAKDVPTSSTGPTVTSMSSDDFVDFALAVTPEKNTIGDDLYPDA